jgi:hypothetical protein
VIAAAYLSSCGNGNSVREWAYADRVYDRQPKVVPAGESLIWAMAKEMGRFDKELRYPGETIFTKTRRWMHSSSEWHLMKTYVV